jgi:hypothetical protein
MQIDQKITIIEGPPPVFELVHDQWANTIIDSPFNADVAVTKLRTFNGSALVERCYNTWSEKESMNLEFKDTSGLVMEVPIVAARTIDGDDGELLLLWVRLPHEEVELDYQSNHLDDEDDADDLVI